MGIDKLVFRLFFVCGLATGFGSLLHAVYITKKEENCQAMRKTDYFIHKRKEYRVQIYGSLQGKGLNPGCLQ